MAHAEKQVTSDSGSGHGDPDGPGRDQVEEKMRCGMAKRTADSGHPDKTNVDFARFAQSESDNRQSRSQMGDRIP